MADKFSHEILLKVVAQICQMVGFEKIMTSVLYTLTDILGAYLRNLGKTAHGYSEHCGRTHVNEVDLSLAFYDFNINPSELVEFLQLVSPLPEPLSVPMYPVARRNQLSIEETLDRLQDSTEPLNLPLVATRNELLIEETPDSVQYSVQNINKVQSQLRENLKIKISLRKIKEACVAGKFKSSKSRKRKKNKENRKRKNKALNKEAFDYP